MTSAKTILAFVALGFAGACSDSVSAPTTEVSVKAPAAYATVLGTKSFRYVPSKGLTQRIGDNVLVIPANGVCDLSSRYGAGHWDEDCAPLTHSIVITAIMYADANGSPYIDFQPALRFVPSKETDLYLKDGKRTNATTVTINYCSVSGCIDESLTDQTLVTQRVGNSRILVRRIKHFSGYNVAAGDNCPGVITVDPEGGLWCEVGGLLGFGRSGYMLATGLTKTQGTELLGRHRKTPTSKNEE